MPLEPRQFELDGFVFGDFTPMQVDAFDPGGKPATTAGDVANPVGDGVVFGYDRVGGMLLTWDLWTDCADEAEARAQWSAMASRWDARSARRTPRDVVPLRLRTPGGADRVVYGRPRRLEPASVALIADGLVDLVADFQCSDYAFYDDVASSVVLSLVPDMSGGLSIPFTPPVQLAPIQDSDSDQLRNAGDLPTWPVITIQGPIVNPSITFVGGSSIQLVTTLAFDHVVTIDPRPWVRSITRQDGASLAGYARGARLAELELPPGSTVVQFRGQDLTGTSSCTITVRSAYSVP
ncbi:hypothetical protein [Allonocardiopsis opalescens]|uniref:Tail protein n=1 Tax=Allonocardiopsis opalescens TaxID=1144618 RepID=A0A2T0PSV4_9ACTN|nr:hypothetical protein [Allonocardiopsis opalescens]PRX91991.1 hypothetical protein CLV72_11264 [Allonocardiopsis opalescens]